MGRSYDCIQYSGVFVILLGVGICSYPKFTNTNVHGAAGALAPHGRSRSPKADARDPPRNAPRGS